MPSASEEVSFHILGYVSFTFWLEIYNGDIVFYRDVTFGR